MLAGLFLAAALVVTPPKPLNAGDWVTTGDYPAEALKQEWEGATAFRLTIAPNGTVKDCVVTTSSGHDVLDQATCSLIKARGRFEPGKTAKGKPAEAMFERKVRWEIPKPELPPGAIHQVYIRPAETGGGTECLVEGSIFAKLLPDACRTTVDIAGKQGLAPPATVEVFVPDAAIAPNPK